MDGPHKDEQHLLSFHASYAIFTLGKSRACSLPLQKDTSVGKTHARLLFFNGRFFLENTHVTDSIWVRLRNRQRVRESMVFRVHECAFRLSI